MSQLLVVEMRLSDYACVFVLHYSWNVDTTNWGGHIEVMVLLQT